jgi:hypothetical protein
LQIDLGCPIDFNSRFSVPFGAVTMSDIIDKGDYNHHHPDLIIVIIL